MIFEAVSVPGVMGELVREAPPGSRIVGVGVCMGTDHYEPAVALVKELELRFAFGYSPAEFGATLGRIAEAPEVRAAITEQGVGMVTDLGRRLTTITERLDDALERVSHRLLRRPEEEETTEVGLATRTAAAAIDVGLLSAALSIGSGLLASVIPFVFGHRGLSPLSAVGLGTLWVLLGGSLLVAFWALVGQTPGMRLLSIHLEAGGSREIGLRPALRRVFALPLALLPAGLGLLAILVSPTRQGWHDRIAGTRVVYDTTKSEAPWSRLESRSEAEKPESAGTNTRSQLAGRTGT